MNYPHKRLLILGGAVQCCKVVEAAKEMGVYTIVADLTVGSPAKLIADETLDISVTDAESIICWCKDHPVDGVLNFCINYAQMTHYYVCNALNLPCFGGLEQYRTLNDKKLFKKLCADNSVDVIPGYTAEDVAEDRVTYPLLVKPADSSGSRGLSICHNKTETIKAIESAKSYSPSDEVLIEQYMGGKQDFAVTYIFCNGHAFLVRTGDRFLGNEKDGLERQCVASISPSRHSEEYIRNTDKRVVQMLTNLGIKNGPVFIQGFIDGDTVRFYDPGIRFPGTEYERLMAKATGNNAMKAMIAYSLGGDMAEYLPSAEGCYRLDGKCSIQLFITAGPGKISVYDGVSEIADVPGVINVAQKAWVGDTIPATGDVKQRVCEVLALIDDNKDSIAETIRLIQSKLRILDENGNDMKVSQIDARKMV